MTHYETIDLGDEFLRAEDVLNISVWIKQIGIALGSQSCKKLEVVSAKKAYKPIFRYAGVHVNGTEEKIELFGKILIKLLIQIQSILRYSPKIGRVFEDLRFDFLKPFSSVEGMIVACTNVIERNRREYELDENDIPKVIDCTVAFAVDNIISGKYMIFASHGVDASEIPTTSNLLDVWDNSRNENVHVFKPSDLIGIGLELERINVLYIV